jgi:hypothetical protein
MLCGSVSPKTTSPSCSTLHNRQLQTASRRRKRGQTSGNGLLLGSESLSCQPTSRALRKQTKVDRSEGRRRLDRSDRLFNEQCQRGKMVGRYWLGSCEGATILKSVRHPSTQHLISRRGSGFGGRSVRRILRSASKPYPGQTVYRYVCLSVAPVKFSGLSVVDDVSLTKFNLEAKSNLRRRLCRCHGSTATRKKTKECAILVVVPSDRRAKTSLEDYEDVEQYDTRPCLFHCLALAWLVGRLWRKTGRPSTTTVHAATEQLVHCLVSRRWRQGLWGNPRASFSQETKRSYRRSDDPSRSGTCTGSRTTPPPK